MHRRAFTENKTGETSMGLSTASRSPQRTAPTADRTDAQAAAGGNGSAVAAEPRRGGESIEQCILRTLDQYFRDLGGARPHQLHGMVMQAVERPLLQFALDRSSGNQSAAADLLGINRNTLRKKLIEHGMAEAPAPKAVKRAATRPRKTASRRKR
jgi:Fis family transcriptional regulator, factor for inversion stimulation protein